MLEELKVRNDWESGMLGGGQTQGWKEELRPPGHGGLINQLGEWQMFWNMMMMVFGYSTKSGGEEGE